MDILRYKQKALGHTYKDRWGDGGGSSSDSSGATTGGGGNTFTGGGGNTWSDASGSVTTTPKGVSWTGTGFNTSNAATQFGLGMLTGNPIAAGIKGLVGGLSGYSPGGSASYDGSGSTGSGGSMSDFLGGGSNLGNAITIAGGINSLTNAGGNIDTGVQRAGDPFAGYRGNLAAMYAGALSQGGQVDPKQMPGYSQWESGVLNPAMEASKRSAAASGMLRSGNEQIALQKTAQQGYYGFMTDYLNRLAQGSGAVNNPATAASLGAQQGNMNQQATMQGIGAIGQGLAGYFSSGAPTPTDMTGFYTPSSGVPEWVGSAADSAPPICPTLLYVRSRYTWHT